MRHIWSVLCQQSITDRDTNHISLINVLEGIGIISKGDVNRVPLRVVMVTFWARSESERGELAKTRIVIVTPENNSIETDVVEIDLREYKRMRFNYALEQIPYTVDGTYEFTAQVFEEKSEQWETVASVPLDIQRNYPTQE